MPSGSAGALPASYSSAPEYDDAYAGQVGRLKFWILEMLPATACEIGAGPGVVIRVDEREPDDLTPALKARLEEIVGAELEFAAPSS